jgi:hypothetical protein
VTRHNGSVNLLVALAARARRVVAPLVVLALLAVATTFLVVPLRTWMSQRDLLSTRDRQYTAFEEVNDAMQDEVDALLSPEGVRQAIRDQLGYLLPNERRIPLLAQPNAPVTLPDRWPYTLVAGIVAIRETQWQGVVENNLDTFDPTRP